MKKILLLILIFLCVGCVRPADSIFSGFKEIYQVNLNQKITLPKKIKDNDVSYVSESEFILIDENVVTGIKIGSAIVEAIINEERKEFTISVELSLDSLIETKSYDLEQEKMLQLSNKISDIEITYTTESTNITLVDGLVTALSEGVAIIKAKAYNQEVNITINVNTTGLRLDVPNAITMYLYEVIELEVKVSGGSIQDLEITSLSSKLEIVNSNSIKALSEGVGQIKVKLQNIEKIVEVTVMSLNINNLNESLNVDFVETLELLFDYPNIGEPLNYKITNNKIFDIIDNVVYPKAVGQSKVRVDLGSTGIFINLMISVTVDPIKLFDSAHIENVLMSNKLKTYGDTLGERIDFVMGGVSKYYFGSLVIEDRMVPIFENEYTGQVATKEMIDIVDPDKTKGEKMPRTGIKLSKVNYITYHDTGNNNNGAGATGNINYMMSPDSISKRSRSWHYTIDDTGIYQTVPEDEVTWQGDHFLAYTESIGIETCVNFNAKHNIVWQLMGKLCARIMVDNGLDMSAIKQHYDWNRKECPQTLRKNNLYPYALSLIETEWIIRRALSGYKITFESLSPEYLDEKGQIIKNPTSEIEVSYKVKITHNNGYNQEKVYTSKVKPLS